jgi:hypothetical protein
VNGLELEQEIDLAVTSPQSGLIQEIDSNQDHLGLGGENEAAGAAVATELADE